MELVLRRMLGEEVGDGSGDYVGARLELRVEGVQEVVAVARIELPRVLAVEGDHGQEVAVALHIADAPQPPHQVAGCVGRRHALIVESDDVGELRVAEHHRHRSAFARDSLRLVQVIVAVELALDRAREDFLVADHPVKLRLFREPDHRLAHRHLGRPHALRLLAEHALEQALAQLDLALGILAMREVALGQLDLRVGAACRVDVADERQDRVVVRRERELSLAPLRELAVLRDDAADALQLRREKDRLVLFGEVAVLALELGQAGVVLDPHRVAPGEVEPQLEVTDVVVGELGVRRPRRELEIARRLLHAKRAWRFAHPSQDEVPLLGGKVARRPLAQVEKEIDRLFLAVVLDLRQQRRHQVEGRAHLRVAVEQRRHLEVVLGRAQAHPGQQVRAGEVVLVIGLVHVPDEGDV